MNPKNKFGKLRNLFFPIYENELSKFIPLCIINFCFTFGYSSLRVLKDSFIISEGGAEALYYLKAYGVTPSIIFFTFYYNFISKKFNSNFRFNLVLGYIIFFFSFYILILAPNIENITLNRFYDFILTKYPNLKGLWIIIKNWPISLFYIHAEIWGSFIVNILFWTLANDITSLKQSKRFYGFFPLAGNIGSFVSGFIITYVFKGNSKNILSLIIMLGIISFFIYNIFFRKIIAKKTSNNTFNKKYDNHKNKKSLKDAFEFLLKYKYLLLIAILVISYNMSTSLMESIIKDRWYEYSNGKKEIISQLGGIQVMFIGFLSVILSIFSIKLQRYKWSIAALFSPIIFLITGTLFFIFLKSNNLSNFILSNFGVSNLTATVFLGLLNLAIIKASKYSFFEPTKESTYIPLEDDIKVRGKASVDGIGSRLGKGISSLLLTLVILPLGNGQIKNVRFIIFSFVILIVFLWIWAVKKLDKEFRILINKEK